MHLSPVQTPDGRPVFSAGGRDAWKTVEYRGYVVSLEWVSDGGRRAAPCMVIWPATNVLLAGRESNGMWVISRRAMVEFVGFNSNDKCTGGPSEHAIREAREAMVLMGKDRNDQHALTALVDCLVRFAPDLHHMPPIPPTVRREHRGEAMWEVKAIDKNTGKTITEACV